MIWRMTSYIAIGMFVVCFSPTVQPPPAAAAAADAASDDVAFASRRDGNWEIYVMGGTGGNQRRLTRREAEDRFPLWSPDRRQIAFGSMVGATWELWVMGSDGSAPRRLASHIVAKSTRGWSPRPTLHRGRGSRVMRTSPSRI